MALASQIFRRRFFPLCSGRLLSTRSEWGAANVRHVSVVPRETGVLASVLTPSQVSDYHRDGFLVVKDLFSQADKSALIKCVEEVQAWPFRKGEHMHYFEKITTKNTGGEEFTLCRTENYLDYHPRLAQLVGNLSMPSQAAAQLLGDDEGSVVFKERINYKAPGGGGFAAHQDAPAWSGDLPTADNAEVYFMKHTLNMNIAIDPMYLENGGLEVVKGAHKHRQLFPQNPDGTLTDEYCHSQEWTEVKLEPGDVLFFSLHIPHRSGRNNTSGSRRAVYITFAARSHMAMDERQKYYAEYRRLMPPAGEHQEGSTYEKGDAVYNWATPISKEQPRSVQ